VHTTFVAVRRGRSHLLFGLYASTFRAARRRVMDARMSDSVLPFREQVPRTGGYRSG
jgi:hypothetical protein